MIWFEMERKKKKKPKKLKPTNKENPCKAKQLLWFLWCRQTPSADSGIIIRCCRSSWPFSPTHSLCCVWYFLSPLIFCLSCVLLSSHSLCCWTRGFMSIPWQKAFEPYQANTTWMGAFWNCSHISFSQSPFSLFLQSSKSRSGLFPMNTESLLNHKPFLQLLCFAYVTATQKFLNKFFCEKSMAFPIPTLLRQELK